MAARKARKTTSKSSNGRKAARTGTKTSKRPKPKAGKAKAEKAKKKKAVAPARKKAAARAVKPKKVARTKPKPVRKAKADKARAKKPKTATRKVKKVARKPVKKKAVARKPATKTRKVIKKVKPAKKVARRAQKLADLREQRRQRRLEEKAARKAAKAEKLKAAKAKAERLKEEKRERIERIRAAKRDKIERIKAAKAAKAEKLRAEKEAKLERIKAEKLAKAEKLKAEKAAEKAKAEARKHEAPPERSSKPGGMLDRKSTPGAPKSVPVPKAPPSKGKGKESERPVKAPSQPPRTRVPLMRTPAVVIPKEPPRPPIEERAASVESRLQQQPTEVLREYEERLYMSWIHHDSALEGVVYTFQELQMAVDPAITVVPDSSIQPICDEIRRHKQAIDFVREQAKLKEPVSSDLIKRIYLFLHPEEGDLKTVKYRKDIPQHRLYFHEYAAPDKIAYGVRQVVEWINDPETARTRGALRIAARAHYDFIRIFPFQTDSGKVARLLMNYILLLAGFPPAIIHSTERQRYYEALKGSPLSVLHMVTEALENSVASIEKFLNERSTRVRSFVS